MPSLSKRRWKAERAGPLAWPVRLLVVCLLVALHTGCAGWPWRGPEAPQVATAERLLGLLKEREAALHTVKGLFRVQVKGPAGLFAQRVEGAMYYRRPNLMRLQGFNQVGGALFDFALVDDRYRLRLPNGKVHAGLVEDLSAIGPISKPIQLSLLAMSGVVGTASVGDDQRADLAEDGERYRLDVARAGDGAHPFRRIWFDRQSLQVVQEDRLNPSGEVDASVQFDDFRPIAALPVDGASLAEPPGSLLKPFKVTTRDGQGLGAVQLIFHEIVPNPVLRPEELGVARERQGGAPAGDPVGEMEGARA